MKFRFLLVPLWFMLLSACDRWEIGLPEHVLARVNEEEITVEEVNREFNDFLSELGKARVETGLKELKEAYLQQVIERKILVQEARRAGIKVSSDELNQTLLEMKSDYPGEGFGEKLDLKGMTLDDWKLRIEEKLLAEKMMRTVFAFRGEIDPKEAFRYYEDHRASFRIKPRVKARQIVVSDGEEAIQILKRLKKGEPFEKLATKKSLGPERTKGGDLGYFSEGERPVEFDSVFSMQAGSISEVIKSPYGYHIFKVEEKIESREIPFEEAKPGILNVLERKKAEEQYQQWLQGVKAKTKIKMNKKWLKS